MLPSASQFGGGGVFGGSAGASPGMTKGVEGAPEFNRRGGGGGGGSNVPSTSPYSSGPKTPRSVPASPTPPIGVKPTPIKPTPGPNTVTTTPKYAGSPKSRPNAGKSARGSYQGSAGGVMDPSRPMY